MNRLQMPMMTMQSSKTSDVLIGQPPFRSIQGARYAPVYVQGTNRLPFIGNAIVRITQYLANCQVMRRKPHFFHVSGAKRISMGNISRRPRNMSKHSTALLGMLSLDTPMVKVFESMP